MNKTFLPSKVNGEINANPSKSYFQRVLIASLLSEEITEIHNYGFCDDSENIYKTIQNLGAKIIEKNNILKIKGGLNLLNNQINIGESGLALRMMAAVAALFSEKIIINGYGSIFNRPIDLFENVMIEKCKYFDSNNGKLPITIQGKLKSGKYLIDGSNSSQFLSGLLMSLPLLNDNSEIHVLNLKSKPYIDLTIDILNKFGIEITNYNYSIFKINGNQIYKKTSISIEGDWSGAAFLLVAGAIAGKVKINNLNNHSQQADKEIIKALLQAGAKINLYDNSVDVEKGNLCCFKFDATDCPDLFPPLAVLAANCNGLSEITGVNRLYTKESNRAESIITTLRNLGIKSELVDNKMIINGGKIYGNVIDTYNDHRIAMMASILALNSQSEVNILNPNCINKSYPEFYNDLEKLINYNI